MPVLCLPIAAEIYLEHRGIYVYHCYREQEYPERYQFQYSLSSDEEAYKWQFDVRTLAGGAEPADPAVLIRTILDRCLNDGELFPYAQQPGPLPGPVENAPRTQLPDDWDILTLLLALRNRTDPIVEPLGETQIADVVQFMRVFMPLDGARQAMLEQWLREER